MLRKCACIDTLYTELPFEGRFSAAAADGFESVEFWDWRKLDPARVRDLALASGIAVSGFNGDADYSLVDPSHRKPYLAALRQSIRAAQVIGASGVTIHSNALGEGGRVVNRYEELSDTVKLCAMYGTLEECARVAEGEGVNLRLEALNVVTDHAGNFLKHTRMAAELCQLIGSPRLRVLFDCYHMQLNEGALCETLSKYVDWIGHIHIADAPGRHEPGTGEICYPNIYHHLERIGYRGRLGYELFPQTDTHAAVAAIMRD
jgi:hydroxypyruvate isomerase